MTRGDDNDRQARERMVKVGDEVEAVGCYGRYRARVVSVGHYGDPEAAELDIYFYGPDANPARSIPWPHIESDRLAMEEGSVFWRWPKEHG